MVKVCHTVANIQFKRKIQNRP